MTSRSVGRCQVFLSLFGGAADGIELFSGLEAGADEFSGSGEGQGF